MRVHATADHRGQDVGGHERRAGGARAQDGRDVHHEVLPVLILEQGLPAQGDGRRARRAQQAALHALGPLGRGRRGVPGARCRRARAPPPSRPSRVRLILRRLRFGPLKATRESGSRHGCGCWRWCRRGRRAFGRGRRGVLRVGVGIGVDGHHCLAER